MHLFSAGFYDKVSIDDIERRREEEKWFRVGPVNDYMLVSDSSH